MAPADAGCADDDRDETPADTGCADDDRDEAPADTGCADDDRDEAPADAGCTDDDRDEVPADTGCADDDRDEAPADTGCTDVGLDDRDPGTAPDTPQETVRKIQRSDMSALPRCYWHLANNSFLLHGYHNYSHLLLVEKDGRYWLGVPGIYDSREARAARLFGFPQFTDSYNDQLQLSDDEKNSQGSFGYWCCYLK